MRFDQAFAGSPLCTPSRAVTFTGLMPHRNGAHKFATPLAPRVKTLPDYLQPLGYRCVLAGKTHLIPQDRYDFEFLRTPAEAIKLLAQHDRHTPLFLAVCTHPPHMPWIKNTTYDPAALNLPPYYADTPETRAARADYYSDVTLMDHTLGNILNALDENGYADNTMVIYTADQGASWPHAKWNLYDEGIRVPFIVRWPAVVEPGTTTQAMIGLVDLIPTFLEMAGAQAPEGLDGRSFLGVLFGEQTHRDIIFAAHTANDNGGPGVANQSPARAARTATHKYILNLAPSVPFTTHIIADGGPAGEYFWDSWQEAARTDRQLAGFIDRLKHRPREELYDLRQDPYELQNLAADPQHAKVLNQLRTRLAQWRATQADAVPGEWE
jgi:arylsulfatase A-like enzyme